MPDGKTLVLDACTTLTFAKVNRLDLIIDLEGFRVAIAARAHAEVKREPAVSVLARAVRLARIAVESVDLGVPREAAALALFDSMTAFRGRGEAEVLALAIERGYVIATDEPAVRDALRARAPQAPFMTSTHVLKQAVAERRLTHDDAVALFNTLDVAHGTRALLRKLGYSIEDLLRG